MTAAAIRRLTLTNFRSYHAASLDVAGSLVVLTGPNGAGKTNLIEAISFLVPGRGLRRATLRGGRAFAKATAPGRSRPRSKACSGLRRSAPASSRRRRKPRRRTRLCRIDREPVGSAAAFADHLRVIWLTPAMDQLFIGPGVGAAPLPRPPGAGGRRRALRAASTRWSARCARATGCWRSPAPIRIGSMPSSTRPRSLRSRSRRSAPKPCAACKARWRARKDDAFPSAEIALDGWMERLLPDHPAVEIEERYRGILKDNRARDAAAGRTLDGPHLTDLAVHLLRQRAFPRPTPRPASRRRC